MIPTLLRVDAHADEARLSQDAQVFGHAGLTHPKALHEFSDWPLVYAQQRKYAPPGRVCEDLEYFHAVTLAAVADDTNLSPFH